MSEDRKQSLADFGMPPFSGTERVRFPLGHGRQSLCTAVRTEKLVWQQGRKQPKDSRRPRQLFSVPHHPSYHNHMIDKLLRHVERYITTLVKKKRGGGLNMWCLLSNHRTTISLVKRLRCIFRQESHDLQVYILNNPDNKNITMQKYLLMMLFVLGLHLVSLGASFLAWCCIIQVV